MRCSTRRSALTPRRIIGLRSISKRHAAVSTCPAMVGAGGPDLSRAATSGTPCPTRNRPGSIREPIGPWSRSRWCGRPFWRARWRLRVRRWNGPFPRWRPSRRRARRSRPRPTLDARVVQQLLKDFDPLKFCRRSMTAKPPLSQTMTMMLHRPSVDAWFMSSAHPHPEGRKSLRNYCGVHHERQAGKSMRIGG